jgi:hypothetical protein
LGKEAAGTERRGKYDVKYVTKWMGVWKYSSRNRNTQKSRGGHAVRNGVHQACQSQDTLQAKSDIQLETLGYNTQGHMPFLSFICDFNTEKRTNIK